MWHIGIVPQKSQIHKAHNNNTTQNPEYNPQGFIGNRKKLVRQIQQQERFLDSLVKDSVGRTVEYHEAQKQNALLLLKEHEIREYYTAQK